ncbi:MAG: hypothetical protein ACREOD_06335 [Candidatus Dormibacteria bacterium]
MTYSVHGNKVMLQVHEHGPATIKAIVTAQNGDRAGAQKQVPSGTVLTSMSVVSHPPLKRVEVRISEPKGSTSCIGSPASS